MKRILTILFISLLFQSTSFSQEEEWNTENYIGINAGGTITSLFLIYVNSGFGLDSANLYLNSYTAGLSFKNFSERLIGISVDLNYIKKGGYSEFNLDDTLAATSEVLYRYSPSYIELTPLMNIRTGKQRRHFNVYAGMHISWLINDKIEFADTNGHTYKNTADLKFEFGLNAGAGYSFDFKKTNLELRFLFSQGLTNVFDTETSNTDLWFNQNQVFSASFVYFYKL